MPQKSWNGELLCQYYMRYNLGGSIRPEHYGLPFSGQFLRADMRVCGASTKKTLFLQMLLNFILHSASHGPFLLFNDAHLLRVMP